jgi:hypothetical protein
LVTWVRRHFNIGPDRIVNVDETHVPFEEHPAQTIDKIHPAEPVSIATEGKEKSGCTVLLGIVADGRKLPPLVIFRGSTTQDVFGHQAGSCYVAFAPKGFMNETIYSWYLAQVLAPRFEKQPVLLIHDYFGSCTVLVRLLKLVSSGHHTRRDILIANASDVLLVDIPPGFTGHLQPLDVSVNGPFKKHLSEICDKGLVGVQGHTSAAAWRSFVLQNIVEANDEIKSELGRSAFFPNLMCSRTIVRSFVVTGISTALDGSEDKSVNVTINGKKLVPDRSLELLGSLVDHSSASSRPRPPRPRPRRPPPQRRCPPTRLYSHATTNICTTTWPNCSC